MQQIYLVYLHMYAYIRQQNILLIPLIFIFFFLLDRITFIADERFQSFYVESSGIWTLQIKYVQARDAGIYECQVSTEPKVSARVHLHVVGE